MNRIEFELNGKTYQLPTYLTIEQYVKIFKIKDMLEDTYFQIRLIHILTGAPMDELESIEYINIEYMTNYIFNIFPEKKYDIEPYLEFEGKKYGINTNWHEMSFAEYVDLDTLFGKKPDEILDYIHVICAILYRPMNNNVVEKYNQNTLNERAELFKKKLDIQYFFNAQFFFTLSAPKSSSLTHQFLTTKISLRDFWTLIKLIWKMRKHLSKNDLDGTLQLIGSQMTISPNTTKS